MPSEVVIILGVLLVGSWFLLDEKKSSLEKLAIVFGITSIYVATRMVCGASLQDILSPFIK